MNRRHAEPTRVTDKLGDNVLGKEDHTSPPHSKLCEEIRVLVSSYAHVDRLARPRSRAGVIETSFSRDRSSRS